MSLDPQRLLVEAHRADLLTRAEQAGLARLARGPRRPGRVRAATARRLVALAGRLDGNWRLPPGAVRPSAAAAPSR